MKDNNNGSNEPKEENLLDKAVHAVENAAEAVIEEVKEIAHDIAEAVHPAKEESHGEGQEQQKQKNIDLTHLRIGNVKVAYFLQSINSAGRVPS